MRNGIFVQFTAIGINETDGHVITVKRNMDETDGGGSEAAVRTRPYRPVAGATAGDYIAGLSRRPIILQVVVMTGKIGLDAELSEQGR